MLRQWGITGAIEAINTVAAAGRTVSPHVFCPTHAHLACAFPNVESVELIPEESPGRSFASATPQCSRRERRENEPKVRNREIGILVDWEAVEKLSRRHVGIARRANLSPATDAGSNLLDPA
jgi:hypothetical protein